MLDALPLANIQPKRFLLQTGAKNYNVIPSYNRSISQQF
jgi:hypothetical protein